MILPRGPRRRRPRSHRGHGARSPVPATLDRKPLWFPIVRPVDLIFRALADPTRRALLDALFVADGQSLAALAGGFDMTRIGVAKHLGLLEEAGLVVARRSGREKLHFLNPVGIRQVHDRWVSKYTEPWAAGLVGLRTELEDEHMTTTKVFEIYIRTTPERLWHAITDPEVRRRFHFGSSLTSDWTPGSPYALPTPGSRARSSTARTSSWTRRTGSSRASTPTGTTTRSPRARHG